MDLRQVECDRCNKLVPASEIRYTSKSNDLVVPVCASCRGKIPKNFSEKRTEQAPRLICEYCNYKFTLNDNSRFNVRCPYCGNTRRISIYKPQTADKLLREVF